MQETIKNVNCYAKTGFQRMNVSIDNGKIVSVLPVPAHDNHEADSASSFVLLPGFADVHTHLREPGFSYKETVRSGTAAAARGGYTAVCSMPNLKPPPDSPEHLAEQEAVIARDAVVRVYPYGCITRGQTGRGEPADFEGLAGRVIGFSDDGKGVQDRGLMREAMLRCKAAGSRIVAHCEDESLLNGGVVHDGEYARRHGLPGICSASEYRQVERDLELVAQTGCPYHVCHVSTRESVKLIRDARADGLPVTAETAPHYLLLCDTDIAEDDGRFKMNPPLRSEKDRDALREAVRDGTIEVIATDHAPHSAQEKSRGLAGSPMGIVGLETAFPVLYTGLVRTGLLTLEQLVERLSVNPRRIFGLGGGEIVPGAPADLTLAELDTPFCIEPERFASMGRATPFAGWRVYGKIVKTFVNGRTVWQENIPEK